MKRAIVLAVPMGDPAGIGPEIVLKSVAHGDLAQKATLVIVGDKFLYEKTASDCAVQYICDEVVEDDTSCEKAVEKGLDVVFYHLPLVDLDKFAYGKISGMCGNAAYQAIAKAVSLIRNTIAHALVTPPLHKESLRASGIASIGHTEILGELTGTANPVTMFQTLTLKVFFMTRHLSLRAACDAVTYDRVLSFIRDCDTITRSNAFAMDKPLAVAGLNPHCGEHGLFGDEEIKAVEPAVSAAQKEGIAVIGPIGADSVFHQGKIGKYRAVLSLYHDQGHIATKTLDFERTISVTWGLPFLRTSVDHGTAYDIAGKGIASSIGMTEALLVAMHHISSEQGAL
ncbi:MAG: 4-hydroxythreonine-4-phosphate dehydrogenase PdxA [Sphaerochaetaceae bacterium]|nr:4-hydroxythreonine-4-phosphate dehydrogenase PdxA [Sphaerochaetaceae bacterium]NLO59576.1 4-hydroxythreonine-4-phosphate dehydrogenase PdxA [Spirochaetales bacterium]MDD2405030.1 4-hydroxythreonine-4-phosphate dehydrogenase PdxA [Sphaerochaetaceae bacterium]MDD4259532.1 4-hydroxythreonine-4-phosphate dehydrogenase PdxA [Sphaerochaetaceae bacterium]MDD4842514.1 4-hydroxythreonine-4-phosphate dehydrogenase PdxA [Sphaerochaetaceae bacterium]